MHLGRRWLVLLCGAALVAAGVAATITAGLGVGSWQVFETGVMAATGQPFAVVAVVESVAVLVLAWLWLGQRPGAATVLFAFVVGPLVGALLGVLPTPGSLAAAVALLAGGTALLGAGVGFYVAADLGASAQDSVFVGLFRRYGWRPGVARLTSDAALVLAGWAIGGQVGVGTVVLTAGLPLLVGRGLRAGARLAGRSLVA